MSLYNAIFGKNAHTKLILSLLGLRESDIERFRDCSIDIENKQITILARTGGGNREGYPNETLTSHPCYIHDHDDEFDCTYAMYYFEFPEDLSEDIIKLVDSEQYGIPASIIRQYNQVATREETPNDKYVREYDMQQRIIDGAMRSGNVICENSWIYVPLNDFGMSAILRAGEEAGGEFHIGTILFDKLKVELNTRYGKTVERVKISITNELDVEYLEHVFETFEEQYPMTIATIRGWK